MPSEAGQDRYYYIEGSRYVRVTTVIQETMAKPALMKWAYSHTRDVISGVVGELSQLVPHERIIDMLIDPEMLEEYLRDNKLRPEDIASEAAAVGVERHALFEELGKLALERGSGFALARAKQHLDSKDGHEQAIADWWCSYPPVVVAAEKRVHSRTHGFAGTIDLVRREPGGFTITDLKNRKADEPCAVAHRTEEAADRCHVRHSYETDQVQVGAYELGWNELYPHNKATRRTVLVAKADGRWVEDEVTLDSSIFLDYLSAWKKLREVHNEHGR